MSKLADAFIEISARGQNAVFATLGRLGDILTTLAQKAKVFATGFSNAFKNLKNAINFKGLLAGAVEHVQRFEFAWRQVFSHIGLIAKGKLSGIAAQLKRVFTGQSNLTGAFSTAFSRVGAIALQAAQATTRAWGGFAAWVANKIPSAFQQAAQKAKQFMSGIFGGGAGGGGGGGLGGVVGILGAMGPLGRGLYIAYQAVTRIGSAFLWVGRTAFGVVSGILSALSSIAGTAYSVCRSIISGLLTPLRWLWNNLFSIRGLLATLGVTISSAMVGRYIAHWTADAEDAAVSFKVLLGSAGQAKTMLGELQELADRTPLQLPEVRDAAKHLLAMGVQATAVTDTIRRLGDVSQGLGLDLNHVADIYGKVSQANRLTGEDMRRFRLNGIPIARELAIMLGKSTQEIEHMAHTGTLRFGDVERVFQRMTNEGGIFFNLMKEKSQTLGGLWSTMQDSMRNLAVYFGQGMAPAVKNIERVMIAFLDNAKAKIWPLRNQFREMAEELSARLPRILETVTNSIPYLVEGIRAARAVMAMLRDIAGQVAAKILSWVGGADEATGGIMRMIKYVRFLANEWELVWAIAKTRMQIFVLDWQNEMVAAFSSLAEKITPTLKAIGEVLKDVFREAVFSLINLLIDGFAAVAPKLRKLMLVGLVSPAGAFAMILKEVHDASAKFFNAGTGDTLEGRLRKLLPKTDTKAADEKRKELDELLDKFNAQFKKFIDEDKLKELNDALLKAAEDAEMAGGKEALKNRPGLPSGEPKEKDKYSFHGLTDFWKHFQSGITPNSAIAIAKQSLEEQKKIKKAQDRTNELLGKRMVPAFGK